MTQNWLVVRFSASRHQGQNEFGEFAKPAEGELKFAARDITPLLAE